MPKNLKLYLKKPYLWFCVCLLFQSTGAYVLLNNENMRRKKDINIIKNGKRQQHMRSIHDITSHTEKTDTRSQPHLCNSLLVNLDLDVASTISRSY